MGTGHAHGHAHVHGHAHGVAHGPRARLVATLALVLVYMVAEVIGGLVSGSLALLADAAHMLGDAGALVIALLAMQLARRPPTTRHTFGYQRAEILAALLNGAALLAIAGYVMYEAVRRLAEPPEVRGALMLVVAAGGLAVNLAGLWLLRTERHRSLNVRGVWLHVLADALGSAGALVAAALITLLGWYWADPVASMVIGVLVVISSWQLLRATTAVLMQATPAHLDLVEIEEAMLAVEGVCDVHDLHIWTVTSGRDVLSAHIAVEAGGERDRIAAAVHGLLRERFGIHHSTVQVEAETVECAPCEPPLRR